MMETLPMEMVESIAQYLTPQDLAASGAVCRQWREIFNHDSLWKPRCDPSLEETLRTTPCVVEPVFVSPDMEGTLSPIGNWKLSFIRENHLWNNWRQGKYKKEVMSYDNDEYTFRTFVTEKLLVTLNKSSISLRDLTHIPSEVVKSVSHNMPNIKTLFTYGDILIIVYNITVVNCFHVDIMSHDIKEKQTFSFNSSSRTEPDVETYKLYMEPCCDGKDMIFLGFVKEESRILHVWNIDTGVKIEEIQCPVSTPGSTFVDMKSAEYTDNFLIVIADLNPRKDDDFWDYTRCYFRVFNIKLLQFLQFAYDTLIAYDDMEYAILDSYVAICHEQGHLKLFNYHTSNLVWSYNGTSDLSVLGDRLLFNSRWTLISFLPAENKENLSKCCQLQYDKERGYYTPIGDKFIGLEIGMKDELYVFTNSLKKTNTIFSGYDEDKLIPSPAYTKVFSDRTEYLCERDYFYTDLYYFW